MDAPVVMFWFVMLFTDAKHPVLFNQPVEDLPACLVEAKAFLHKPPHELLLRGGKLTAGCEVTFPEAREP